jgi:hypothetical protein
MKWMNPERLDVYGVRLVGWPPSVPALNPSTLRVSQNRELLEAFKTGIAKFERLPASIHPPAPLPDIEIDHTDEDEDFSWAFDADASPKVTTHASPVV